MHYRQGCVAFSARPEQAQYWDKAYHSKRNKLQQEPKAGQAISSPLQPEFAVAAYVCALTATQSQPLPAERIYRVASTAERDGCLQQLLDGLHARLVSGQLLGVLGGHVCCMCISN